MASKQKVAFIGTGIMGAPIAGHIMDAGYPVVVYNRTKAKAEALLERAGLELPLVARTWAELVRLGAASGPAPVTVEGLVSALCG